jgi:hypothetical protein
MDLLKNPFYILGASTTDSPEIIRKLVTNNEKGLSAGVLSEMTDMLLNPSKRLVCELYWLPEANTDQIRVLLDRLNESLNKNQAISFNEALSFVENIGPLAKVNVLTTILKRFTKLDKSFIHNALTHIFINFDNIDHRDIFSFLNNDRQSASISAIYQHTEIISLMVLNKDYYVSVVRDVFDDMDSSDIIIEINGLIDSFKNKFNDFPQLLRDFILKFEFETENFFRKEESNIKELVEILEKSLDLNYPEKVVDDIIKKIIDVFYNWEAVFHSIHRYYLVKSEDHSGCLRVYKKIRDVSLLIFKKYKQYDNAILLIAVLKSKLHENKLINNELTEDIKFLVGCRDLFKRKFSNYLSYKFDILEDKLDPQSGDTLKIDDEGVKWKGKTYFYSDINRLRWGKVSDDAYLSESDETIYKVIIKKDKDSVPLELDISDEKLYVNVVNRLWSAVGGRIINDYLEKLKSGKKLKIRNLVIKDNSITQKFVDNFSQMISKSFKWSQIIAINEDEKLKIISSKNYFYLAEISNLEHDNLQILQTIIQMANEYNCDLLSDLLKIKV